MDFKKYTEANRKAWNQVMPYHRRGRAEQQQDPLILFQNPEYLHLEDEEIGTFRSLGIEGKSVAHVSCNNGLELISITRLGAASGIGFDISDEAIADAQKYASSCGAPCKFYQTDVYDIDATRYYPVDFVYFSIGAFCWLPELSSVFSIAAKMLKKEGYVFIFEGHPFLEMVAVEGEEKFNKNYPLNICRPYFPDGVHRSISGMDYIGKIAYDAEESFEFAHPLSDIFTGLIQAGLEIVEFAEYSTDISAVFSSLEKEEIKMPLSMKIVAKKK